MSAIAAGAIGLASIMGGLAGKSNQKKDQQQLNEQAAYLNYKYGEEAAQNAFGRQMQAYDKVFEDNTMEAQVKRAKDAGMNPALLYGGGAGGGQIAQMGNQSIGATGGAEAGRAPTSVERQMAASQVALNGMQAMKLKSEVAVNESLADKNKAEAGKVSGVDTEEAISRISLNNQTVQNREVEEEATRINNRIDRITANLAEYGEEEKKAAVEFEADRMWTDYQRAEEELQAMRRSNRIGAQTEETAIEQFKASLAETYARIIRAEAETRGIEATTEQTQAATEAILKDMRNFGAKLPPWTQFYNNYTGFFGIGGKERRKNGNPYD